MANKNQRKQDVFCLLGPTASGKTSLAVELVKCFPFEIVSVDSAQIYRGMDIGTGKPSKTNLAIAPHPLHQIRDPLESYSAADFRTDAIGEIWSIVDSGKVPLLVGGTMLYFKVLRDGLADLPRANSQIRRDIEKIAAKHGWAEVHGQLAKVDPGAAASIHPNDPQRLQRALEVFLISGKKLTDFYSEEAKNRSDNKNTQPFNLHFFGIQPEARTVLHRAIEERFNEIKNFTGYPYQSVKYCLNYLKAKNLYLDKAGIDSKNYSGHSLRSGFATSAAEAGAEERSIMAMTGHKSSEMVRRYIKEANLFKNNALSKIKI